uniref:Proteasome activator Blm10 mid region domain-containing protein n=1 Tax=Parascaris univalens TaxID=6257 RepID=A0A915A1R8_PARUN
YCNYNTCKRQWITEFQGSSLVCNKTAVTHRTLKTSAKMSTESVEVKRAHKAREPLRRHALVLLDALVSAIDINDVVKLSLAFRIIATFFTLFPIVDCSNAPNNQQYGILNEEEKSLCALTATIPRIITKLLDRVLTLISQLATAVPKDSTTCLDSICDVSGDVGFGSEDEILVNIRIQSTFRSLLNNSSPAIVQVAC